jgi:hypothetical protein
VGRGFTKGLGQLLKISPENKWIILNIGIPFAPFVIGGLLRLLVTVQFSWNTTFEGSEIAICLALLSFFVAQSLHCCRKPKLDNKDKQRERRNVTAFYYFLGAIFLVIFVIIVFFTTLNNNVSFTTSHFESQIQIMQGIAFGALPLMAIIASRTQRIYHLESSYT